MTKIVVADKRAGTPRSRWIRFNVYFLSLAAVLIALNAGLPFVLKYIHPCAEYIEVDIEGLIAAFVILLALGNVAYWGLVGIVKMSARLREHRHALAACLVLVAVAWLLSRFYVAEVIPTLLQEPELLCD